MNQAREHPTAIAAPPAGLDRLVGLVRAARPGQWVKNLACFAGLIFSERHLLFVARADLAALVAFAGFSLAASGSYLINDVFDAEADRRNPKKRHRPIASGVVPPGLAVATAAALYALAMATTLVLAPACSAVLAAYIAMNLAYSWRLKHTVLLDVMVIALGFVLRVLHGVYAVEVRPSAWIALCMFFLALFLGFAKRRGELDQSEADDLNRRPVLRKYRVSLLDQLLAMTAVMAILCYAIYTVIGRPNNATLVVTVPLVVHAMLRYLLMITVHGQGDEPERLVTDRVSLMIVAAWAGLCVAILYLEVNIFAGR